MISISPINNASKAAQYYLGEEKNLALPDIALTPKDKSIADPPQHDKTRDVDSAPAYYLKETQAKENARWYGTLAENAQLTDKPVDERTLTAVLNGSLNDETVHFRRQQHRAGFDLTLSAPKSVSYLALVGGDDRLLAAHRHAVNVTLDHIEYDVAQVKHADPESHYTYENTRNLLFAVIGHKTSRDDDPQLHDHVLMANMTRDSDDKLRALATCKKQQSGVIQGSVERLYHHQKYYTAIYQSALASESQQLGYATRGVGNGQFEIAGIPQDELDTFSKRSQDIDAKTSDIGLNSQKTRDLAAKNTRKGKSHQPTALLHQQWQRQATFNAQQFVVDAMQDKHKPATSPELPGKIATEALQRAADHLIQTDTRFSYETLVSRAAGEFVKGDTANVIDIKHAADQALKQGGLIALDTHQSQLTTREAVDKEQHLIQMTRPRQLGMAVAVNRTALNQVNLNIHNKKRLADMLYSTKQTNIVNVYGHSEQLATSLLHVATESERRVHYLNPTARDTQQSEVSRPHFTLTQWVKNAFRPDFRHTAHRFLDDQHTTYTQRDIILVDQANKLGIDEITGIIDKAQQSQSKVIFLNRARSKQGIRHHNAMAVLATGNVKSTEWVNNRMLDTKVTLSHLDNTAFANHVAEQSDQQATQVIAATHKDVENYTPRIREALQQVGKLSRHTQTITAHHGVFLSTSQREIAKHYQVGMILREWNDDQGKKRPTDYRITGIDTANNQLALHNTQEDSHKTCDPSLPDTPHFTLLKPVTLDIAQGEKVAIPSRHFGTGLEGRFTVSNTNARALYLTDNKNRTHRVNRDALNGSSIRYDYVVTQPDKATNHLLAVGKSYHFDANRLHDLSSHANRVDIFTDNVERAHAQWQKSADRPAAIERVMHTETRVQRYLNEATRQTVINDVNRVMASLTASPHKPVIEQAVDFALRHLSEKEAAFTQHAVVQTAIRYAFEEANQPITQPQIVQQLDSLSHTLSSDYQDGVRWTTKGNIDLESRILTALKEGQDSVPAFATPSQARDHLNTSPYLTAGQKEATTLITTTADRVVAVQGLAGTGKSTMLESNIGLINAVRDTANAPKLDIVGLAPTHAAVNELKAKGVESQTLASLLTEDSRGDHPTGKYANTLFFLDESAMVGNAAFDQFLQLVKRDSARAVVLGDREQLLSQHAGKPFELAISQGVIKTAYMSDIVRQDNTTLLGAVHNIVDKQATSALEKIEQQTNSSGSRLPHLVSTLDETAPKTAENRAKAAALLPSSIAKDYLSRTPETRENTLIIAYTNRERDEITHHIRPGLIQQKQLGTENVPTPRLRSVGATETELATMLPYQKGLIYSEKLGQYSEIVAVDREHSMITLLDQQTGKITTRFPTHKQHQYTQLFSLSEQPLSTGDKIMARMTDKKRGIVANTPYTVTAIDNNTMTAQPPQGDSFIIERGNLKDAHWDYRYTRTADMAQGATYANVISAIRGNAPLTDIRRAYVDITRAAHHVRIYTDDPDAMTRTWYNKETNKPSAMETHQHIARQQTWYFNDTPHPVDNPQYQNQQGEFIFNKMATYLKSVAPKYTESLATALLGRPNTAKSNSDQLSFGHGSTALNITLTGEYRGYFKDWTTGEKGDLINLIMTTQKLSYKEALYYFDKKRQDTGEGRLVENPLHDKLVATTPKHISRLQVQARQYFQQGVDIKGTAGETYLNNTAGVQETKTAAVKFHPAVYSSETKSTHPALITNITDQHANTQAIEVTYISPDGSASELNINKRILGKKSGYHVNFHEGEDKNITIITNSIEQAFKVRDGQAGQQDIVVVQHKNDIQNINPDALRHHLLIVLDSQQGNLNRNNIDKILERFKLNHIDFIAGDNIHAQIDAAIHQLEGKQQREDIKADPLSHGVDNRKTDPHEMAIASVKNDIAQKTLNEDLEINHSSTTAHPTHENERPQKQIDRER